MKTPTEAELIELEDWLSYQFREPDSEKRSFYRNPMLSEDSAIDRIRLLISLARDPSGLLRIALDTEALKWERPSPRKGQPEPVPSLQPKQKSKSKNR